MLPSGARDSDEKAVSEERNRFEKLGVKKRKPSAIKNGATPSDHPQTSQKIDRRGRLPSNSPITNGKGTIERQSTIPVRVVKLYEKKAPPKTTATRSVTTTVSPSKDEAISELSSPLDNLILQQIETEQRNQREKFEEMVEQHKRHAAQRLQDLLEAISMTDQKIEPPNPSHPTTPSHLETTSVDSTEVDNYYTEDQIEREILLLVSKTKTHRHTPTALPQIEHTRDEENPTKTRPAFSSGTSSDRDLTWNERFERKQKELTEKKKSLQRWQHELDTKNKPEAHPSGPILARMEEERRQLREKEEELTAKQVMHRTARIK